MNTYETSRHTSQQNGTPGLKSQNPCQNAPRGSMPTMGMGQGAGSPPTESSDFSPKYQYITKRPSPMGMSEKQLRQCRRRQHNDERKPPAPIDLTQNISQVWSRLFKSKISTAQTIVHRFCCVLEESIRQTFQRDRCNGHVALEKEQVVTINEENATIFIVRRS